MTTELFTHPVAIILYMYIGLWIWETAFPARQLPYIKYWKLKGILLFIFNFLLSTFLPLAIDTYLAPFQLFNLAGIPLMLQVAIGVFIYQSLLYFWHRAMHRYDALWKIFHQMHHSAERLDVPSAFYSSPTDTIGLTTLGSISFVLIVGLTAEAATISLLALTFFAIFQHANIKTPVWVGYLVQRPESHSIHHGRGLHRYNYSDLPILDIIFGTFKNPECFADETGFYDGASKRIGEMLMFKDVSRPGK